MLSKNRISDPSTQGARDETCHFSLGRYHLLKSGNMDFHPFTEHLSLIASDRALTSSFRSRHPDLVAIMKTLVAEEPVLKLQGPFPAAASVMQVTVYDNWRGPKPPKPNWPFARYGLDVKAWIETPSTRQAWWNASWHGECRNLWPNKDAVSKARRLLKRGLKCPITESEVGDIETLRDNGFGNIGILHHKVRKSHTQWFQQHFATLTFVDGGLEVLLFVPGGMFRLSDFTTLNADGTRLTEKVPNAIGQVRYSTDPTLSLGATNGWTAGTCRFTAAD